jgi:hypothetical protein
MDLTLSEQDNAYWPFRNFVAETKEELEAPGRLALDSDVLFPLSQELERKFGPVGQQRYRNESDFLHWASKLGINVWKGYPTADGEKLWIRGWLRADAARKRHRSHGRYREVEVVSTLGQPLGQRQPAAGRWHWYELDFHPFRLYPLMRCLDSMSWRLTRTSVLHPKGLENYAKRHVRWFAAFLRNPMFMEERRWCDGVADLCILLEPIYWPSITNRHSGEIAIRALKDPASPEGVLMMNYKEEVLGIVRRIYKSSIALAHERLRFEAAKLDNNHELYLLLRGAKWSKRERIEGSLGAALWLRHMAELLRLAFDEVYEDRLVHEDEAIGWWHEGARKLLYGSEYPLENVAEAVRRILPQWGVHTGPRVRFYVEGETEQGALEYGLDGYLGLYIEVVNLRGDGKLKGADKDHGSWLQKELERDVAARRLSMIMLDDDCAEGLTEAESTRRRASLRSLRKRASEGSVVGMVFVNSPDIETACFTIPELVKAAGYYEQEIGEQNLAPLDIADFAGVKSGKEFEQRYCKIRIARSIKGRIWGEALMRVAFESGRGEAQRLVFARNCAIRGIEADYDFQRDKFPVDPVTLESPKEPIGGVE